MVSLKGFFKFFMTRCLPGAHRENGKSFRPALREACMQESNAFHPYLLPAHVTSGRRDSTTIIFKGNVYQGSSCADGGACAPDSIAPLDILFHSVRCRPSCFFFRSLAASVASYC